MLDERERIRTLLISEYGSIENALAAGDPDAARLFGQPFGVPKTEPQEPEITQPRGVTPIPGEIPQVPEIPTVSQMPAADVVRGLWDVGIMPVGQWNWRDFLGEAPDVSTALRTYAATKPEELLAKLSQAERTPIVEALLRDLFPEASEEDIQAVFVQEPSAIPGYSLADLARLAESNPDEFLKTIRQSGRTAETENLLRNIFPEATEEDIEQVFDLPRLLIDALPMVTSTNVDWAMEYFPSHPEALMSSLIQVGKNPTTIQLVKTLYPEITDEGIKDFFSIESRVIEKRQKEIQESGKYNDFVAGVGDLVTGLGSTAKWLGADGIGEKISQAGKFMQASATVDDLGEFHWSQMLNPKFYTTRGVRLLPNIMLLAIPGIGGAGAGAAIAGRIGITAGSRLGALGLRTLQGIGGAVFSRPLESALEAGGTYDEAVAKGLSPEAAKKAADTVFKRNLALAGTDAVQLAASFAPINMRSVTNSLLRKGLVRAAKAGAKLGGVGLTEAGEEAYQDIIQRQALGEEVKLDPEMQQVMALGFVAGGAFAGGIDIFSRIQTRYAERIMTTPKLNTIFDNAQAQFEGQGLEPKQVMKLALDTVADTQEGGKIADQVVKEVQQEVLMDEVKPKDEAEAVAWEHLRQQLVEKQEQLKAEQVPVKPEEVAVPEAEAEVAVPKAEAGEPEAGLQPSMLPEEVAAKEVRPVGKGKITQAQMDDFVKLKELERSAELETQKEQLAQHPARDLIGIIKRSGKMKGEMATLTIRQYKDITGKREVKPSILTPDGKHVRWEYALDELATERGYADSEALKEGIEEAKQINDHIKQLESQPAEAIGELEAEAVEAEAVVEEPPPVVPPAPPPQAVVPAKFKKPLEPLPEPTPEQVSASLVTGQPALTTVQVQRTLDLFGKYVMSQDVESAWELTRELRRETRAERANDLKARTQELIISKGMPTEEAMRQAIKDTMSGELPSLTTEYLSDLTENMRVVLFDKVYRTLKEEPYEMMSTAEALSNALQGKPIPREPGTKGGSALTRLQRVFSDQPQVMKAIDTIGKKGKPLKEIFEGIFHEVGRDPIPVEWKDFPSDFFQAIGQPRLGEKQIPTAPLESKTKEQIAQETLMLRIELAESPTPVEWKLFGPEIDEAIKQMPMFPRPAMDNVVQVLKEIGMSPVDIGNFLRANKASFDFSFWRQQAPVILNHKLDFVQANIEAWNALWSQKATEASWERISRDPLYQIYESGAAVGGDFLRPITLKKGTAQWQGVEEFGYLTGERLIPRITEKLPWVKVSQRAFVTGTNVHNWRIFKQHYNAMLKLNEQYASGEKKLKPGESFSVEKEMIDYSKSLANFTARGSLGKFKVAAPELSGLFFAPRAALGRLLIIKDLVNANPRVRLEAWKNAGTFVAGLGGLILTGATLGWWDVERDPRSAEYMSIRIGNTRVDPWGGYRQFVNFFARVITRTGISSITGQEYTTDPLDLIQNFIRGKASPLASTILDFWKGKNFVGEPVDVKNVKQWVERISPFVLNDIYEAFMDDPRTAFLIAIPAIVGAGVQTYTGDWKENWLKLGTPKYTENLQYGLIEPRYDIGDWWADTAKNFKGVDPATLTEAKGFPPYIKALAEAILIKEYLATLPSEKLNNINADPTKGATFVDYFRMWRDRQEIVASGDEEKLKAFDADERTRNAYMGNFPQAQLALLRDYYSITDRKKQTEFLKLHPELNVDPREDWLRSHSKENAQLARFGQAKILSREAYDEVQRLIKELDIPENAVEMYLPPKTMAKPYFDYEEVVDKWGANSAEARLLRVENPEFEGWMNQTRTDPLENITEPIESLKLKVKNRELQDRYDAMGDRESPDYIADDKERQDARQQLFKENPDFRDDLRRVDAYKFNADAGTVDEWVEYGKVADASPGFDSETKVWLVDHPETWQWALENKLLTDDGKDWNIPVLRINAKYRQDDIAYTKLQLDSSREAYLKEHKDYAKSRIERNGYQLGLTDVTKWTEYNQLTEAGYWRERYRLANPDFEASIKAARAVKGLDPWEDLNPSKIPAQAYDEIYLKFQKNFDEYKDASDTRKKQMFAQNPVFKEAWYRREAYGKFFPEKYVGNFVSYYLMPDKGYDRERYLSTHQEFYREAKKRLGWQAIDFDKIPSEAVEKFYDTYLTLAAGTRRMDYRLAHPELDEWLVRVKGYSPAKKKEATTFEGFANRLSEMRKKFEALPK